MHSSILLSLGVWSLATGCAQELPGIAVTGHRPDTQIEILAGDEATRCEIRSQFGIGRAKLRRIGPQWPKSLVFRLHLKGLESLKVTSGDTTIEWSISSNANHHQRVTLIAGKSERPLTKGSPYWTEVRMVGLTPAPPMKDGFFDVPLPAPLLADNPPEISLRWVDFYR